MAINHKKQHLLPLLKGIAEANLADDARRELYWGYLSNWLPEPEAPRIFAENKIPFTGKEKRNLYISYHALRDDRQTEYLKDRELNERLSGLMIDAIWKPSNYSNQSLQAKKVDEFLSDLLQPLADYEVMFRIHNMNVSIPEIEFWDVKLARLDGQAVKDWGLDRDEFHIVRPELFEDKNVIIVHESGNSSSEVEKRARITATRRLRALQTFLRKEFIHDFQLQFAVSDEYVIKKAGSSSGSGFRTSTPLAYDYERALQEEAQKSNETYTLIKKLSPPLREIVERALNWTGLSISEVDYDIKIAYLCTALETLLTTKQDGRKGEKIAYRGYLLTTETEERSTTPQVILRVYEIRSSVVHGSKLGVASKNDFDRLFRFTESVLDGLIKYAIERSLTKPTTIFNELLASKHLTPLQDWLNSFHDESSIAIRDSIEKDLSANASTTQINHGYAVDKEEGIGRVSGISSEHEKG